LAVIAIAALVTASCAGSAATATPTDTATAATSAAPAATSAAPAATSAAPAATSLATAATSLAPFNGPSPSVNATARGLLPPEIVSAGVLHVATGTTYGPYAYLEGSAWIGHDVDLLTRMAADLGLKIELANVAYSSLVPGVQSGRYDVDMDGMGDNADREKVIDFVNYYLVYEAIVVPKGNPKGITSTNFCGFTFTENVGSLEIGEITEMSNWCKAQGKPEITTLALATTPLGFTAMETGRADAMLTPAPPAVYAVHLNPSKWDAFTTPITGFSFSNGLLLGIGVAKGRTGLQKALAMALDDQIQSGFYAWNANKYGMPQNGLISKATINYGPAVVTGSPKP
jgi:polar amino acid transport system substrate-binding protein